MFLGPFEKRLASVSAKGISMWYWAAPLSREQCLRVKGGASRSVAEAPVDETPSDPGRKTAHRTHARESEKNPPSIGFFERSRAALAIINNFSRAPLPCLSAPRADI